MANRDVERYKAIERASALEQERKSSYRALYTEQDALRLSNAYLRYPWVNPQILVSTVLSGNDDAIEQIAEYAATKMAEAGYSPAEMSREDDLKRKFNEEMMYSEYSEDPSFREMADRANQMSNIGMSQ
jgi:hypothetical protein